MSKKCWTAPAYRGAPRPTWGHSNTQINGNNNSLDKIRTQSPCCCNKWANKWARAKRKLSQQEHGSEQAVRQRWHERCRCCKHAANPQAMGSLVSKLFPWITYPLQRVRLQLYSRETWLTPSDTSNQSANTGQTTVGCLLVRRREEDRISFYASLPKTLGQHPSRGNRRQSKLKDIRQNI